jgi:hypothetical protein
VPSSYGGRASSIIKVDSRDGNEQDLKFKGGVGMIGSRLTVDIPVVQNKSSLVLSGRVSYSDWLTSQVKDITVQESSAQFYDTNAKWHYTFSESDKVELSGYFSADKFRFGADTLYQWSTMNGSAKWHHSFNKVLSSSVDLVSANYSSIVKGLQPIREFELNSAINYLSSSLNLYYNPSNNYSAEGGFSFNSYSFSPGELTVQNEASTVRPLNISNQSSTELSFYLTNDIKINRVIDLALGIRFTRFNNLGEGSVLLYEEGRTKSKQTVIDSIKFSNGESIKTYSGFEPRASINFKLNPKNSIKTSYTKLNQYIHIISNKLR